MVDLRIFLLHSFAVAESFIIQEIILRIRFDFPSDELRATDETYLVETHAREIQ